MGSPIWATVTLPTHYMPIPAISLVAVNGAGGMSFGATTPGHSQDSSGIGICNRQQYIARWRLLVSKGWGRIYAFYGRCGLPRHSDHGAYSLRGPAPPRHQGKAGQGKAWQCKGEPSGTSAALRAVFPRKGRRQRDRRPQWNEARIKSRTRIYRSPGGLVLDIPQPVFAPWCQPGGTVE